jgi:uncharacterized membrane protein YjjP (DUF1212 family)
MDVGALMLFSGAAAAEVVRAMLAVAHTADMKNVTVDVTYSVLTFSYTSRDDVPYTIFHAVSGKSFNYGKLTDVLDLVDRFCREQLTIDAARAEIRTLATSVGPYPWWLTRLAAGFAGANAAIVFGGTWLVVLAAFVANIVLDYLLAVLTRRDWLSFYMQALAGCVAVLAAEIVHRIDPTIDSSQVVVSVIIVMLAGITSTGGVQDAITGWYVTALGRIFEAVMNTLGLVVGVAFGLLVAQRMSVYLSVTPNVHTGSLDLGAILVASAFVALGFSLVAQNPPRILLPTAVLAMIGYAVFHAASLAHLGTEWSSGAAAVVVGMIAILCTQRFKAPAGAFAVCAILPLLPGLKLYQGLTAAAHSSANGVQLLVSALGIALGLAGGLTLGQYIGISLWRTVRPVDNPFFTPLFAKPFGTEIRGRPDSQEESS